MVFKEWYMTKFLQSNGFVIYREAGDMRIQIIAAQISVIRIVRFIRDRKLRQGTCIYRSR